MNDTEIKLQFEIMEQKHQNSVGQLESRLSELSKEIKHFKETHASEHMHEEKELSLKIELLFSEIKQTNGKISLMQEQEQKDLNKKTFSYTAIGVWIGAISLFIMMLTTAYSLYKSETTKEEIATKEAKQ